MIQLSRHIEVLLLENDCVVIPGFGGIIAYTKPAAWNKNEHLFTPPARTIGFNPQLKMNDGLLVQSYMRATGTIYAEANSIVQKEVNELTTTLNREGKVVLPYIGEISYSADESYTFLPYDEKVTSPSYYGLNTFEIQDLHTLAKKTPEVPVVIPEKKSLSRYITPVWQTAAAIAAVIVMLFFMSTPIENTYVEKGNYAHVLPAELFNKIKENSLITTEIPTGTNRKAETPAVTSNDTTETDQSKVSPVVKEVKVPKSQSETVQNHTTEALKYHLIVASVVKEEDGNRMVEQLHSKGYSEAKTIVGDGRVRIGIASYATRKEATDKLTELRKIESYENAWLLVK